MNLLIRFWRKKKISLVKTKAVAVSDNDDSYRHDFFSHIESTLKVKIKAFFEYNGSATNGVGLEIVFFPRA